MSENQDKKCVCCGEAVDEVVQGVQALHDGISGFLEFGSPADLLEEIAHHLRFIFESDDEDDEISVNQDLTKN